jgi:hypothetical protein
MQFLSDRAELISCFAADPNSQSLLQPVQPRPAAALSSGYARSTFSRLLLQLQSASSFNAQITAAGI